MNSLWKLVLFPFQAQRELALERGQKTGAGGHASWLPVAGVPPLHI
jgi:hypothetical protein